MHVDMACQNAGIRLMQHTGALFGDVPLWFVETKTSTGNSKTKNRKGLFLERELAWAC